MPACALAFCLLLYYRLHRCKRLFCFPLLLYCFAGALGNELPISCQLMKQ